MDDPEWEVHKVSWLHACTEYRCRHRPCGRRVGGFKHEPSRVYRGIRGTEYRKRHLRQDSHAAWLGESPDIIFILYCRCPFETPSTVKFLPFSGFKCPSESTAQAFADGRPAHPHCTMTGPFAPRQKPGGELLDRRLLGH